MLQFENVTKTYDTAKGPVHALLDLTLHVEPGEFVTVRGPSGCGKSTLLTLAGGLATPTSGRVSFAAADLASLSSADRAALRAEKIGFVFQLFHLLPYLNVLDNVVAAALPGKEAEARENAHKSLERFGLADRLTHRPGELSAGERQRVAMARALLNRPRLILADEPTGNLDPESATIVLDILADFNRDGGTVLLVTHDERAAGYGGRSLRLDAGRLVGDSTQPVADELAGA